jgi:S-adenosylmethionine hydrolase
LVSAIPYQPLGRPAGDPTDAGGGGTGTSGTDLKALVTWIDRFGNVQLGAGPSALHRIGVDLGGRALVAVRRTPVRSEPARWVDTFGHLEAGALGVLVDSTGRLALVLNRASAADHLGRVAVGDTVRITPDRTTEAPG